MATRKKRSPKKQTPVPEEGARERILKIAAGLFADKGLDGVTVRDIAKAAKLNLSLVSYYFGGKEALYRAVLEEHAEKCGAFLRAALDHSKHLEASKKTVKERLHMIVSQFVQLRMENVDLSVLMQRERLSGLPFSRKIYEETMAPLAEDLIGLIVEAQRKGVVRADLNARSYFISLVESIFGYFAFHDCGLKIWKDAYRFPEDKDEYIHFLVRLYTEGIFA